ncbi:hypothetical protein RCO27_04615 [Sphingosinicella sp. LHD-64]|uniref:hypothetical protein n=1 Tax=Sphingosinicella sp. LHD-64 TaxID=3072139 RepID=UPI00280FBFE6|nr:hypothetical protein [Sphingosinicella sp. LHD-64]MDQ8755504.1 hypothetical protein [Sphingosinicella sp. LHD-64]
MLILFRNRRFDRAQSAAAAKRPNLSEDNFVATMEGLGGDEVVAVEVYRKLTAYCRSGVFPNPGDLLDSFFGIDADELEGLIEDLFQRLALPIPSGRTPEHIPPLETAADLVLYLSHRRKEIGFAEGPR